MTTSSRMRIIAAVVIVSFLAVEAYIGARLLLHPDHTVSIPATRPSQSAGVPVRARPLGPTSASRVPSTVYRDRPVVLPLSADDLASAMPPEVKTWISNWEADEMSGHGASDGQIMQLRAMLKLATIPAASTAQLVCLISFIDGNDAALGLVDLAVDRGRDEMSRFKPPDAAALQLVAALWPLHDVLWAEKQWALDQELLETVRPWEVYGSAHSQWASYQYAECLQYEGGHYEQSFEEYQRLQVERKHATEPSLAVNRPLDWELAGELLMQYKYAEAVPYLRAAAKLTNSPEAAEARWWLIIALARSGDREGSKNELVEWIRLFHPDADRVAPLLAVVENPDPQAEYKVN